MELVEASPEGLTTSGTGMVPTDSLKLSAFFWNGLNWREFAQGLPLFQGKSTSNDWWYKGTSALLSHLKFSNSEGPSQLLNTLWIQLRPWLRLHCSQRQAGKWAPQRRGIALIYSIRQFTCKLAPVYNSSQPKFPLSPFLLSSFLIYRR